MKLKHSILLIASGLLSLSAQATTLMITQTAGAQLRDTTGDGIGDGLGGPSNLITGYFLGQDVDLRTGWAFLMSGAGSTPTVTDADFTAQVTSVSGTPDFNVDLHAIRVSPTSTFNSSDFQVSSQLIMEDFWTPADGTGSLSLDAAGKTALASYLDSNWSDGDYVILGTQTDPSIMGSGADRWFFFNNSNAVLAATVPEPSSSALFLLGGLGLIARRKR